MTRNLNAPREKVGSEGTPKNRTSGNLFAGGGGGGGSKGGHGNRGCPDTGAGANKTQKKLLGKKKK